MNMSGSVSCSSLKRACLCFCKRSSRSRICISKSRRSRTAVRSLSSLSGCFCMLEYTVDTMQAGLRMLAALAVVFARFIATTCLQAQALGAHFATLTREPTLRPLQQPQVMVYHLVVFVKLVNFLTAGCSGGIKRDDRFAMGGHTNERGAAQAHLG